MDLTRYEKTRYQNIYRNIRKGNYIVRIKKPVQTTISTKDGKKMYDINEAKDVRNDIIYAKKKAIEIKDKEDFDDIWCKYITYCEKVSKLAYNTLNRKTKDYNRYLKNKIHVKITKTDSTYWAEFIDNLNCSNKQKNHILKILKAFFNWCISQEITLENPITKINKYKVENKEMKYWTPKNLEAFMKTIDKYCNSENKNLNYEAHMIKVLTAITFAIGDRVGETRALTFECINKEHNTLTIAHSINYDRKSNNFFSSTKTNRSQRTVVVTGKLINTIEEYKYYLKNVMNYDVNDDSIIFFNYKIGKPYSDTILRKYFYKFADLANVPKIRMYDLRHTYVATMMLEGRELYHISEELGHSNITTTYREYGHLSNQIKEEQAKLTDKYW